MNKKNWTKFFFVILPSFFILQKRLLYRQNGHMWIWSFWWYKRIFCNIKNLCRIRKRVCPVFFVHPLIKEFSSKVPLIVNPVALSNPNTCTYHFTRKSCKCKSLMPLFELSWGGRCSHNSHPGGVPGVVSHILIWDKTWNSKRNGRLDKSLENK